jgi:glycosyltransferase involved in cell wall biosynthesis
VSSAIGGTDELIEHEESGLLFARGDVDALVGALRRVLADEPLRSSLGQRARDRARREFTSATMVQRVVRVYEELLGDTSNS